MANFSRLTEKLTPEQAQAIAALLESKDIRSAAAKAGCGERTLYGWLAEPDFKKALQAAEALLIDMAVRRLAGIQGDAIETLSTIMKSPKSPKGVRVRAATVVLEQLVKLRELNNWEERLAALEERGSK